MKIMMIQKPTQERVVSIIAQWCLTSPSNVRLDHELFNDLNCDSLDMVEILIELEEEFNIEITDDDFLRLVTVRDVTDFIINRQESTS